MRGRKLISTEPISPKDFPYGVIEHLQGWYIWWEFEKDFYDDKQLPYPWYIKESLWRRLWKLIYVQTQRINWHNMWYSAHRVTRALRGRYE